MNFEHRPVLANECIKLLDIKPDGIYIDGTAGGGGHSAEILKLLGAFGTLICIDQDTEAIEACKARLEQFESSAQIIFENVNFENIIGICRKNSIVKADGILLDLGVSSYQLDNPERGFSYMSDAPLDMRMSRSIEKDASHIVNRYDKDKLAYIIKKYGEEKWASRIAEFIIKERENKRIEMTGELVDIIKAAIPASARRRGPHPAKRTFQALRIEVNRELEVLKQAIKNAFEILKPGGIICIITFHSLEDRIVKQTFRDIENPCSCPAGFPACACGKKPGAKVITSKPIVPSKSEIGINPRARSAKLRAAFKV